MTPRLETGDACALQTCLLGDEAALRLLLPMLPAWPIVAQQAAATAYLAAGAVLTLQGGPHDRASIAAAWREARPGILADLAESFSDEVELAGPIGWLDNVLGGEQQQWCPAYDALLHAAVALRVAALIWASQNRPWSWLAAYLAAGD